MPRACLIHTCRLRLELLMSFTDHTITNPSYCVQSSTSFLDFSHPLSPPPSSSSSFVSTFFRNILAQASIQPRNSKTIFQHKFYRDVPKNASIFSADRSAISLDTLSKHPTAAGTTLRWPFHPPFLRPCASSSSSSQARPLRPQLPPTLAPRPQQQVVIGSSLSPVKALQLTVPLAIKSSEMLRTLVPRETAAQMTPPLSMLQSRLALDAVKDATLPL